MIDKLMHTYNQAYEVIHEIEGFIEYAKTNRVELELSQYEMLLHDA